MILVKRETNREDSKEEVKRIKILIGDKRFTLTETIDGKLEIQASGHIAVYPGVANVINVDSVGDQW